MGPGEINVDPIEGEFFSTEALDSLADALVREAVQNSLDARLSQAVPARVRFTFPRADDALGGEAARRWLDGLRPHLEGPQCGLVEVPDAAQRLTWLLIEDFGSRGLQGDPGQTEDRDCDLGGEAVRNDFFYFWRNVGRTGKHAADLGRWGLGKTVFQAASRINSFFALTQRADDGRSLLMGQSVLKIHRAGGRRYAPYGYFGLFEGDLALPVEDAGSLGSFRGDFGIRRAEPGLSVVIPHPAAEVEPMRVLLAAVHHYFVPILNDDLVFELAHPGGLLTLDARSLAAGAAIPDAQERERLRPVLDLTRWALDLDVNRHFRVAYAEASRAPQWSDSVIAADDLALARREFERQRRVAFRCEVPVKAKGREPEASRFWVYLERAEGQRRGDASFVRQGITLTGIGAALPPDVRALVYVTHPPLARLLGDSENPAHTEWQERSPKFKDAYTHGPSTLRFVKNAPRELFALLVRPPAGRDERLLREIFSLALPPAREPELAPEGPPEPGPDATAPGAPEIDEPAGPPDRHLRLARIAGGFRLAAAKGASAVPPRILVRAAFEVRRGDPFRRYDPLDFRFGQPPLELQLTGAEILEQTPNALLLGIGSPEFQLVMRGFDRNRDLRVRIEHPLETEG